MSHPQRRAYNACELKQVLTGETKLERGRTDQARLWCTLMNSFVFCCTLLSSSLYRCSADSSAIDCMYVSACTPHNKMNEPCNGPSGWTWVSILTLIGSSRSNTSEWPKSSRKSLTCAASDLSYVQYKHANKTQFARVFDAD